MAARTTEPRNVERQMNGEGQRPPGTDPQPAHDAPEPGNARYPQNTPNGQQQQSAEGSGRRRFRRQRRGGQRGRPPQNQQRQQRPQPRQEPPVAIEGVLDVDHRGNGRLRSAKLNFLPQQDDPDVPRHMIERDRLREGSLITGQAVRRNGRLQLIRTETVEGLSPQQAAARTLFQNLTVIDPDDRLIMETTPKETLT